MSDDQTPATGADPGASTPPTPPAKQGPKNSQYVQFLLALRFGMLMALLAAYAIVGTQIATGTTGTVIGLVLMVIAGLVYALVLSPMRRVDPPVQTRVVIEVLLYAVAAALLVVIGRPSWGVVLLVAEAVVLVLLKGPDTYER